MPKEVEKAIRRDDIHEPSTGLICVENACLGGTVVSVENLRAIKDVAEKYNLPVHLDGARIFNAAEALGVDVKEITACCDSVMFCLSKGLGAPVGSIVAGSKEFIEKARRKQKLMGGGMRQVGILAAAGLIAIDEMTQAPVGSIVAGSKEFIEKARRKQKLMGGGMRQVGILAAAGLIAIDEMTQRLDEDHRNSHYLAEELDKIDGISVNKNTNDIRMVYFTMGEDVIPEKEFVQKLYDRGIKISGLEN